MKQTIRIPAIFMMMFLLFTSAQPIKKNNQIYGTWRLSSGKHNGNASPQLLSNRSQSFNSNKTFVSQIKTANGTVRSNGGVFYMINDTTMVTYHQDLLGKLDKIANTYNFHIKNDSLHFYGFYLSQSPQNKSQLIKVYIDEWWVKADVK